MEKIKEILKLKLFWYYFSGFVVVTLFTILAFFDLQISQDIVNIDSKFGKFMETFGIIGSPVLCMLASEFAYVYNQKHMAILNRNAKLIFWRFCNCTSFFIICIFLFLQDFSPIYIIMTFILNTICFFIASNCSINKLKYLFKMALLTMFYVVTLLLIVQILKLIWGRVRYVDLQDIAQFSPWYVIQGINGHKSFPSGHTANAMSIFVLTLLNPILKNKALKIFNWIFVLGWIFSMAFSRVLVGAHYCSDVLFSIVLGVIWFYFCEYLVTKILEKSQKKYLEYLVSTKQGNIKSTIITKDGEEI